MSGKLKIEIKESKKQLVQLLRQEKESLARERIQILYWLKTGQAETVNNLATLVGRHRTTVSRWLRDYRSNGMDSLTGLKQKLSPNIPQASFISSKNVQIVIEPLYKTTRYCCPKCF